MLHSFWEIYHHRTINHFRSNEQLRLSISLWRALYTEQHFILTIRLICVVYLEYFEVICKRFNQQVAICVKIVYVIVFKCIFDAYILFDFYYQNIQRFKIFNLIWFILFSTLQIFTCMQFVQIMKFNQEKTRVGTHLLEYIWNCVLNALMFTKLSW